MFSVISDQYGIVSDAADVNASKVRVVTTGTSYLGNHQLHGHLPQPSLTELVI